MSKKRLGGGGGGTGLWSFYVKNKVWDKVLEEGWVLNPVIFKEGWALLRVFFHRGSTVLTTEHLMMEWQTVPACVKATLCCFCVLPNQQQAQPGPAQPGFLQLLQCLHPHWRQLHSSLPPLPSDRDQLGPHLRPLRRSGPATYLPWQWVALVLLHTWVWV